MKTPEELNVLKEEVETLKKKLAELTEDELKQVAGGSKYDPFCVLQIPAPNCQCEYTQCTYLYHDYADYYQTYYKCMLYGISWWSSVK